MRWYNYFACFAAGVILIHILPHVLNGLSVKNVVAAAVSLGIGLLLLRAGRFSFRDIWALVWVVAGMAAVLLFVFVHPHHAHGS